MSLQRQYEDDGVVLLKAALPPPALAAAQIAYEWSLANPGPGASRLPPKAGSGGVFLNDLFNPRCLEGYREMLLASPLPRMITDIWGAPDIWFFYEQIFLKEGGETRRTPWHQDSSYLAIDGQHLAVAWITFDPTTEQDSLEFVRGSHKGVLYATSRFDPNDDTAPIHPDSKLPRLPDIEADRSRWDIVAFATQPGDVVLFHPKTLHGGAPTHPEARRRTLTLRFFGEDAVYDARESFGDPAAGGYHARLKTGDRFRDPAFLKLQ